MDRVAKIIWTDGGVMYPQLFQHQDVFHESSLRSALRRHHPYPWGVLQAKATDQDREIDRLELRYLEAVLPDGTTIAAPVRDQLPMALSLSLVPPESSTVIVCVTLPAWRHEGANCPGGDENGARYTSREAALPDIYRQGDTRTARLASAQPKVTIRSDVHDPCELPIMRLRRTPTGRFRVDDAYMAPVVNACDSPALLDHLKKLLESMHGRIKVLTGRETDAIEEAIAFRAGDNATFWLLQTLNGATATITHLLSLPVVAPERVFQELLRLAGDLLAFSHDTRHDGLPTYVHADSDTSFTDLFATIMRLIDTVIPTRYTSVPLDPLNASHHTANLPNELPGEDVSFYLAVSSDLPPHDLVASIPKRLKLGAADDVAKAVSSALGGIPLTHVLRPPAAVPVKAGQLYFALNSRDPSFSRMWDTKSLTAFIPDGMGDVGLELLIVSD